jgi:hypothetical protein
MRGKPPDLDGLFGGSQSVQPGHQRVVERRWNFAARGRRTAALHHCASQFLDEQRHPTGTFDNRLYPFPVEDATRCNLGYHLPHVPRAYAVQRDLAMMRAHRPRGVEFRASCIEQHQRHRSPLLGEQLLKL